MKVLKSLTVSFLQSLCWKLTTLTMTWVLVLMASTHTHTHAKGTNKAGNVLVGKWDVHHHNVQQAYTCFLCNSSNKDTQRLNHLCITIVISHRNVQCYAILLYLCQGVYFLRKGKEINYSEKISVFYMKCNYTCTCTALSGPHIQYLNQKSKLYNCYFKFTYEFILE